MALPAELLRVPEILLTNAVVGVVAVRRLLDGGVRELPGADGPRARELAAFWRARREETRAPVVDLAAEVD